MALRLSGGDQVVLEAMGNSLRGYSITSSPPNDQQTSKRTGSFEFVPYHEFCCLIAEFEAIVQIKL